MSAQLRLGITTQSKPDKDSGLPDEDLKPKMSLKKDQDVIYALWSGWSQLVVRTTEARLVSGL